MRKITTGVAIAIFSDIRTERYTTEEKMRAIEIVLGLNRNGEVRKTAAFDVIKWLVEQNKVEGIKSDNQGE